MSRLETRYSKFSSFEDRGQRRVVRVSSDCQLTFDRYCRSLSCNDKSPCKNDKGENDISLRSVQVINHSRQTINRPMQTIYRSEQTINRSMETINRLVQTVYRLLQTINRPGLGEISLRANDISLAANNKSHRTQRDIVIVKTVAPRYFAR